jgi:DNA repair protein REV1
MSCADDLQAVSVDEALIDVTSTVAQMKVVPTVDDFNDGTSTDIAKELAETIRAQIKAITGCEGAVFSSNLIANTDNVFSEHWNRS